MNAALLTALTPELTTVLAYAIVAAAGYFVRHVQGDGLPPAVSSLIKSLLGSHANAQAAGVLSQLTTLHLPNLVPTIVPPAGVPPAPPAAPAAPGATDQLLSLLAAVLAQRQPVVINTPRTQNAAAPPAPAAS